jgi:restriction system protein
LVIGSPIGGYGIGGYGGGAFGDGFQTDAFQIGRSTLTLVTESLVLPDNTTAEGALVTANSEALLRLLYKLSEDWTVIFQLDPRKLEELLAAAYDECGYRVTLTPRSGDHGRDLIAEKQGFGAIKLLGQAKLYKPDHVVTAEEARALLGVLAGDLAASKGVLATSSSFAPKILDDPAIGKAVPTRLQLINGEDLQNLLRSIANGEPVL